MATTFGTRPEDTVADSRGNVLSGVALTLYATKADATAQTAAVSTVTTNSRGLWSYSDASSRSGLWVRDPGGGISAVAAEEVQSVIDGKVTKGSMVVSVKDYGAVGDGVTDDTAAVQAALTATGWPSNRAKVVFPGGSSSAYNIAGTITINGGGATSTPHLVFEGHGAVLQTATAANTIVSVTNSTISTTRVHFVGLQFKPNATGAFGVTLNNAELTTFDRCGFLSSFATGIKITGTSTYTTVTGCEFGNIARGIEIAGDASYMTINACQFNEQLVGSPLDWIGQTTATTQVGVKITGCTFYGTGATREVVYLSNASACLINGNTFERSPLGAIFFGTGGSADTNNITANTFIRTKNGSDVRIRGGNRCIVSSNNFGVHDAGTTTGTYSNIKVEDPFTTNQGSGTVVMGNASASTAAELHSFIRFDSTCKNNSITGNVGRASIVAADASNVLTGNIAA